MLTNKQKRELMKKAREAKEGQYGIETLTKIQFFKAETIEEGILLAEKIKNKEKGIFFFLFRFLNNAVDLGSILSNSQSIANEYQDLTEQERDELNKIFSDAFDIDNNQAEELAERTNLLSHHLAEYIEFALSMKK